MKVTGNRILVVQATTAKTTDGGIVLPDQMEQKLPKGTVMHVGPDCKVVGTGDRVVLNTMAGLTVAVNKVEYLLLEEEDVLVVLEEGED